MGFSGQFVKTTQVNTDKPSRVNWGTGVDPGHAQAAMGDDQGFPALTNPYTPDVPEQVVDQYNPTGVNADPNILPPDREPRGHGGTGPAPLNSSKYAEIKSDTKRHSENFGATLKNTMSTVMRSITQTFATPRVPSLPPSTDDMSSGATGAARRALRGFNSFAMNNPGSAEVNFSGNYIRRGFELSRLTDRRMARRTLTHTYRPIYLNVAKSASVPTSPLGKNYSPYGSPFPSVASLQVGTARPMARREPRAWDESVITDGSEDFYRADTSQYNSWGL